ncbi:MAG: M28 family peptidase [Deltaproteobacteria bacterium]|nr:M28 family peptidase [Deltaproteobacteria bacterium]
MSRRDVVAGDRSVIPFFENDQDRFFDAGIPAVWFMTPGFSFYHQPSDDPDTVDYDVLLEATSVLAKVIDVVANDDRRYGFAEEVPVTARSLLPYRTVFQHFAGAEGVLSPLEIGIARNVVTQLDQVEAAGTITPERARPLGLEATGLIFLASVLHPGEVPVPFPAGATAAGR